jgi:hypothetical protein
MRNELREFEADFKEHQKEVHAAVDSTTASSRRFRSYGLRSAQ